MTEPKKHGGYRPGAGRPKSAPVLVKVKPEKVNPHQVVIDTSTSDARAFLAALMLDDGVDVRIRADAAKALLSAELRSAEAKGKKEAKQEAAENVAGRFAPSAPPKLAAVGGTRL